MCQACNTLIIVFCVLRKLCCRNNRFSLSFLCVKVTHAVNTLNLSCRRMIRAADCTNLRSRFRRTASERQADTTTSSVGGSSVVMDVRLHICNTNCCRAETFSARTFFSWSTNRPASALRFNLANTFPSNDRCLILNNPMITRRLADASCCCARLKSTDFFFSRTVFRKSWASAGSRRQILRCTSGTGAAFGTGSSTEILALVLLLLFLVLALEDFAASAFATAATMVGADCISSASKSVPT